MKNSSKWEKFRQNSLEVFEDPVAGSVCFDVHCSYEESLAGSASCNNQVTKFDGF
jgi:hypothetical protein